MKKRGNDVLRIKHIVDALEIILNSAKQITDYEFYQSDLHKYAVLKQIEIIGEASNYLSEELRNRYTEINWRELISARNGMCMDILK